MASVDDLLELLGQADPGREDSGSGTADEDAVSRVDWPIFAPRKAPVDQGEVDWDLYGDKWHPEFPPEWIDEIEGALESGEAPDGPEAPCGGDVNAYHRCAWYIPLHLSPSSFGIYIRESCVLERAVRIAAQFRGARLTPMLLKALYRAGAYQLFLHEQFHHKVESFGFRLVIVEGKLRYVDYETKVYRRVFGSSACLEEALANADAYRRLEENTYAKWTGQSIVDAARRALELSWRSSPPGYDQAPRYKADASYHDGLALLKAQVHEASVRPSRTTSWKVRANFAESMFPITSHIYTVYPVGTTPLMPIR